jgi:hypothetical protein
MSEQAGMRPEEPIAVANGHGIPELVRIRHHDQAIRGKRNDPVHAVGLSPATAWRNSRDMSSARQ